MRLMKRSMILAVVVVGLIGCEATQNPFTSSFSPTSFKTTYPPVAQARVLNVGHVDPMGVYRSDFAEATLVGTAVYVTESPNESHAHDFALGAGADLVLWRRAFEASRSDLDYTLIHGGDQTSTTVRSTGGTEVRTTTDPGWTYVPTSREVTLYRVDAVLLRTSDAVDAPPIDPAVKP